MSLSLFSLPQSWLQLLYVSHTQTGVTEKEIASRNNISSRACHVRLPHVYDIFLIQP